MPESNNKDEQGAEQAPVPLAVPLAGPGLLGTDHPEVEVETDEGGEGEDG